MLLVLAGAIALAGLFYWRAYGMLRRGQWQILLLLRALSILIVVLLLFRPVFSYHKQLTERAAVIFLLDRSASMGIADDASGKTRFEQAREQISDWWLKLEDSFDLRLIEFSDQTRRLQDAAELATLVSDGKATSLSRALAASTKERDENDQPLDVEAVILLSDGAHNSARSPLELSSQMPWPVHTVGVGASLKSDISYRDIQVTGLNCPERMMLNNKAKINAAVEGVGLAGRVIQVFLDDDGQQIAESELTLDNIEGSQTVEFEIRPTVKGRHTYTVRIPPISEEKIEENNQRTAVSLVVEPGLRVLYIEGTLRAEYGALVDRFLAKDPDLEFCALVQTRPNHFLKRTNIEGLQLTSIPSDAETINTFDVFLIGDLDSTYLKPEQQQLILDRVRQGAGLIMLGGYHSLGPGGYGGTPIGEALPVVLGSRDIGQLTDPFLPTLTPEGARHPIFANIAHFFPTETSPPEQDGLPPLDGCTRVAAARPGAAVLATCAIDVANMPVLAVQPAGEGRSAVFCGDTTRKWQQGPRAMDQESPFLRFWGQMIRWAAGRSSEVEAKASIVCTADKSYYEPDEPVKISAIVRDDEGQATGSAQVRARIKGPSGGQEEVELGVVAGPAGHYGATFEPREQGTFEIVAVTEIGGKPLEAEKVLVEIGRPNLEFDKLDLDEKMLAQIASDSGGRYLHITAASLLVDQLDRTIRKREQYLEKPLFWPPAFWVLFVGLITTEWILRRRFQLR